MIFSIHHQMTIKNYVLQTRAAGGSWRDHRAYHTIDEAEREYNRLARHRPDLERRIFNRATGQVVRS